MNDSMLEIFISNLIKNLENKKSNVHVLDYNAKAIYTECIELIKSMASCYYDRGANDK